MGPIVGVAMPDWIWWTIVLLITFGAGGIAGIVVGYLIFIIGWMKNVRW